MLLVPKTFKEENPNFLDQVLDGMEEGYGIGYAEFGEYCRFFHKLANEKDEEKDFEVRRLMCEEFWDACKRSSPVKTHEQGPVERLDEEKSTLGRRRNRRDRRIVESLRITASQQLHLKNLILVSPVVRV